MRFVNPSSFNPISAINSKGAVVCIRDISVCMQINIQLHLCNGRIPFDTTLIEEMGSFPVREETDGSPVKEETGGSPVKEETGGSPVRGEMGSSPVMEETVTCRLSSLITEPTTYTYC